MLERDKTFNDILDRIEAMEARLEDLRDVSRPAEVVVVEQPEWQALAGWVSTGSVLRDIDGKIILDPNIPRIQIAADGYIESADFVTGVSGFQIDGGMAEFNNVVIRGTIYADAGEIGGWTITASTIEKNNAVLASAGYLTLGSGNDIVRIDAQDATYRLWTGHATAASAPFRVSKAGEVWATDAHITGEIDANSGHIGTLDIDGLLTVGTGAPVLQLDGPNKLIQSSTFASGITGMRIAASGDAEFNNVRVRGALTSMVFVRDLLDARAGSLLIVKSAGTLYEDMAVPGAGTWTMTIEDPPGGGFLFENSDICRCKTEYSGGIGDIWFVVSARVDNGDGTQSYTCTYSNGTRSITYPAGAPVLDYGVSGDGGLFLTADDGNAPFLSIFTHAGAPWATQTERLRLGNLAGWQGAGLASYGIAMGDYAGNEYAYYTPGTGMVIRGTITADDGTLVNLSVTGTLSLSGSGKLITAASPNPRIELTTTLLAGYSDATTKEFYIDASDGKARAGAGKILIDSDAFIKFTDGADNIYGSIGWVDGFGLADPMVVVKALKAASYAKLNLEGVDGSAVMGGYNDAVTRERWLLCTTSALTYGDAESGLMNPYFTVDHEGLGGLYGLSVGDPTTTPASGEIWIPDGGGHWHYIEAGATDGIQIRTATNGTIIFSVASSGGMVRFEVLHADYTRVQDDLRVGFGLYVGGNVDPDDNDIHFEGNLKSVKAATHDVYAFHPLAAALTSTSWDGDAKAAGVKIDLSAVFGAPAEVKAIAATMSCKDESTDVAFGLGPAAGTYAIAGTTQVADKFANANGVVPCDAGGDVFFSCSGELDNVYVYIWGYWI